MLNRSSSDPMSSKLPDGGSRSSGNRKLTSESARRWWDGLNGNGVVLLGGFELGFDGSCIVVNCDC